MYQRGGSGGRAGESSGARVPRWHTLVQRADAAGQRDENVGVVEQLALALGNVGATHDDELEQFKVFMAWKRPAKKKIGAYRNWNEGISHELFSLARLARTDKCSYCKKVG